MGNTVLLIDGRPERRRALRHALERRGHVIAGEAGSVAELVQAVAGLSASPSTILVGSALADRPVQGIAELLKRTWPKATVIEECPVGADHLAARRRVAHERRTLAATGA